MGKCRTHRRAVWIMAGLMSIAGGTRLADAAVVMEADFRVDEDLTVAGGSGTTDLALAGNASVNSGPAMGDGYDPRLAGGYLQVLANNDGLYTTGGVSTGPGEWRDYFGSGTFGNVTFITVFRPHFPTDSSSRHTLFGHQVGEYSDQVWFYFNGGDELELRLGRQNSNNDVKVKLTGLEIDHDTWYFLAFTFREDDTGLSSTDPTAAIYMRAFDPEAAAHYATSSDDVQRGDLYGFRNKPVYFGNRDALNESAKGDIAFIQVHDEYFSQQDLEAIYNSLIVPEPGALGLLGLGVTLLVGRRARPTT